MPIDASANLGLGGASANPFLGQDNSYLQKIIDMSSGDLVKNWNTAALPAFNAGMIKSGSFGNSGVDEMTRMGAEQLQKSLGDNASKLRFNDYTQQQDMYKYQGNLNEGQRQFDEGTRRFDLGFDRDTFNDAFSQNRMNMQDGIGLIDWMSGRNATDLGNATTEQNAPINYYERFASMANGLGGNGSTTTGTQGTTSNPVMQGLGAAQLGSSWFNSRPSTSTPSSSGSSWDWGSVGADGSGANGGWWA